MEKQEHNPYRPERAVMTAADASDPTKAIWQFSLPVPVTTNKLWKPVVRQTKNGRVYPDLTVSPEYKAWKQEADGMLLCQPRPKKPLAGVLHVAIRVSPEQRDLDNYLKSTLDALQSAGIIEDDMQIADLSIRRKSRQNPKCIWIDIYASDIYR